MNFQCPICGYNRLQERPVDFSICPCCGVEFGYDDFECSHSELTQGWIKKGYRWFSAYTNPPVNWDPKQQLIDAGIFGINEDPNTDVSQGDVVWSGNLQPVPVPSTYGNIRTVSALVDAAFVGSSS